MKHRNDLMLLRIAQGDAYGLAAEYTAHPEMKKLLAFEQYMSHPTYHKMLAGNYSDDGQMSIAVAETLLEVPEVDLKKQFTRNFLNAFKRDERNGYARHFQKFLETVNSADEFLAKIDPNSDRNGAAMRSVPLGVVPDVEYMLHLAEIQASITHNTLDGVFSSKAVALMSHFALYDDRPLSEMLEFCTEYEPKCVALQVPWSGSVEGPRVGWKTVHAVFDLVTKQTSLLGIMRQVIDWGGDTDSVAAIAWGIASARMTENLPEFFERDLEASAFGAEFLKKLGKQLMETYAK